MGCNVWLGFRDGGGAVGKVGAQILGRFEEVTTLKVVASKVDVWNLPTAGVC